MLSSREHMTKHVFRNACSLAKCAASFESGENQVRQFAAIIAGYCKAGGDQHTTVDILSNSPNNGFGGLVSRESSFFIKLANALDVVVPISQRSRIRILLG